MSAAIVPSKKGALVAVERVNSSTSLFGGMARRETWTIETVVSCDRAGRVKKVAGQYGTPRPVDRYTVIHTLGNASALYRANVVAIAESGETFDSQADLVAAIKGERED